MAGGGSAYAQKGSSGGSVYAQRGSSGGSVYAGGSSSGGGGGSSSAPKKKHHGFLATLKHVVTQTPKDLANAAYHAPGGIYHAAKEGVIDPAYNDVRHGPNSKQARNARAKQAGMATEIVKGTVETVKHPLRHPGDTALLLAPVVGRVAKLGEAGALAKGGASAGDVVKAATVGVKPGPRVLKVGDMEVRGHYSRAAGSRVVQKTVDRALEKGATKSLRVENQLHRRAAKWESRNQRTADAVARAPGTRVAALGAKLTPAELRALRLVAEETPVERRLGAQEMRKGRATNAKEQSRHQERIDLTKAAMEHLTSDAHGKPTFKPEAVKLRKVYEAVKAASDDREGILKNLDLMDDASLQAAKTKTLRTAVGLRHDEPGATVKGHGDEAATTPPEGRSEAGRAEAGAVPELPQGQVAHWPTSEELVALSHEAVVPHQGFRDARLVDAAIGAARNRHGYEGGDVFDAAANLAHAVERQQALVDGNKRLGTAAAGHMLEQHGYDIATLDRQGGLGKLVRAVATGHAQPEALAEFMRREVAPTASPDAIHIGNPVERTKLRGKPKVSSTGTFGHTQKPSSLKTSTGGSVEHALERNDVTNIVAERHAEVVRLGKIDRVVQRYKAAGEHTPRRKDDVWMWTDKVVSNERIPKDVREYLDNPESLARLTPDKQQSVYDKIRDATFEKHDWQDSEKVAGFEKLAKQGKGVFVPRKLLGEFAKRSYSAGDNPAVKFVDAVNNAQKAGLVYLKLNYPLIQGVSNTAMNLIQGAFHPQRISEAIKAYHDDPEITAIANDIMGQGAITQAAFEGQGAIARSTQNIANVMSSKVDTPARLLAFYHEAAKMGYKGNAGLRRLILDDKNVGDLYEAAQRGREAIVDYGDMGPVEKNVVRRIIFVYPWQKGAVKYAGNFLRDHPVQAAALSQLGELGKQQSDEKFGAVPSYLQGLIPVDGKAVNPSGVNFFQTPAQIGTAVAGIATGDPAQRSAGLGFLAPAPGVLAGLLSGSDDIGRPLKGNPLSKVRDLTLAQTSLAGVARTALPDSRIANALLGTQGPSKTFPGVNDPYWRFFLGGLYPRKVNAAALNQNAAREKTGR